MTQPIAREEARAQGRKTYFTGIACAQGHLSDRMVSNRGCCECLRENARAWRCANPDKRRELNRKGRSTDSGRERARHKARQWYEENKQRAYEASRRWKERNKDRLVPLFGKLVSGLHVPGNLRVIPAVINQRKSNKFDLANALWRKS